jgi:transcriptional regulator with XRE-family HTH domain
MSIGVTSPDTGARPNSVAIGLRKARGWSQRQLAQQFEDIGRRLELKDLPSRDSLIKQISRVECGYTQVPDELYLRLWCEAFGVDAAELFGHLDVAVGDEGRALYSVTSHKIIPVYLSPAAAAVLVERAGLQPAGGQWWDGCLYAPVESPWGNADLYLWPWGVAVVHLREDLHPATITDLAIWRRATYPQARAWVDDLLTHGTGESVASAYTFSVYWLHQPKWRGDQLDTALRLLSMPAQLLNREDDDADEASLRSGGELVERTLLRDGGVDRADLRAFGSAGVSIGYASWSSIAYYPLAPRRAITPLELVACELLVQGVWCYTAAILDQVELGRDPVVPDGYGWRFLRAVRSRLFAARPLETGQTLSMREAVLVTSKLGPQVDAAIGALRESFNGG